MLTDDDAVDKAALDIQMLAETGYALYRSNGELTPDARLARLAQVYCRAADDMEKLGTQSTGDSEARKSQLFRQVFGTAGLPGDPASLAMSARDAAERVAQIDVTDWYSAQQLLDRADLIGDEVLARALAAAAYNNVLGGWASVLDGFVESRPAAAAALSELEQLQQSSNSANTFARNWQFVVQKPAELAGLDDWRIRALAAGAPQ